VVPVQKIARLQLLKSGQELAELMPLLKASSLEVSLIVVAPKIKIAVANK
jgi:hypothetical protein